MKALFILLVSLLHFQDIAAQKAVVANLKMNVTYIGIPNPLGILVEGFKWGEFEVTTNNGKIEIEEDEKSYFYYPKNAGEANIFIKSKKGDTIGIANFRAWNIPNPIAQLNRQRGGKVKKSHLLVFPGISCQLDNFDFDIRFVIRTYSVSLYRNDSSLLINSNIEGPLFSEDLKQQFRQAKEGDKLIFYGITAQAPDKRILELSPMEFTIIEE